MMPPENINFNEWADFWRNEIGVNVIPANSITKKPKVEWKQWQDKPIPEDQHISWKESGMFDEGMAVICGRAWHIEKSFPIWLNMCDLDNAKGIEEFCSKKDGSNGILSEMASQTLVEQHANKNKAHVYCYSDEPFENVPPATGDFKTKCDSNQLPAIEVKSYGNKLSYCAPGPHKDGSQIKIIGTTKVTTVDSNKMNQKIFSIRKKHGMVSSSSSSTPGSYLNKPSILDVVKTGQKVVAGQNRHEAILRYTESLRKRNPGMPREWYVMNVRHFNENNTTYPLSENEVDKLIDQGLKWIDEINQNNSEDSFTKYEQQGTLGEDEDTAAYWMTSHYITKQKIIEKNKVMKKLASWKKRFNLKFDVKKIVDGTFNDEIVFEEVRKLAYEYGKSKISVILEKTQTEEAAYWILGRYHIKRIGITGEILFFNDRYYEGEAEYLIRRAIRDILFKSNNASVNEILSIVGDKSEIIQSQDIEKWSHLVCLNNGIYDVQTGVFSDIFSEEWIILNHIPWNYDENKSHDGIDNLVREIAGSEKNMQSLYDFMSICFYPKIGIYKQLGLVGPPGTGKTELCSLQNFVFGDDNVRHASIHQLARDATTQNDIAFKTLNIDADLNSESVEQIDTIKKWVTRDPMTARSIYDHTITYKPTARLMFAANDLYEMSNENDADAIYDRTHLITIEKRFRDSKNEIKNVMEKTVTDSELDGLVTHLLKNATQIYKMQNIHHPMAISTIKDQWDRHTKGIKLFVAKWIVKDENARCVRSTVNERWIRFCEENGITRKGRNKFYEDFEDIVGVESVTTRVENMQGHFYFGIRLKSPTEVKSMEQKGVVEFC